MLIALLYHYVTFSLKKGKKDQYVFDTIINIRQSIDKKRRLFSYKSKICHFKIVPLKIFSLF